METCGCETVGRGLPRFVRTIATNVTLCGVSEGDERTTCPWPATKDAAVRGLLMSLALTPTPSDRKGAGWAVEKYSRRDVAGLTDQRLTRAARAHVPKPTRRSACTHGSRAMQAARRRSVFDFTSRLGRRAEAGPRRVLPRVRRLRARRTPATLRHDYLY